MKNISEEILQEILDYIDSSASTIDHEYGFSPFGGVDVIRTKDAKDEAVLLYDKVKMILNEKA